MSVDLPPGWSETAVGNVARIVGGGTPPSKDSSNFAAPGQGTPWVTPADLSGYRGQTISHGARDLTPAGLAACSATLMPAGTVLFSSRAPIGYVAIAANTITTNQGFKSFVLPVGTEPRFFYYQLRHLKREAEAIATGTTFKELSGAAAATLPVKVAPSREQARIADQLDTLLARVNACNDRLDTIPAFLKRFRQAVLDAAASGALTADWRQERTTDQSAPVIRDATVPFTPRTPLHSLPAGWRWARFEEFVRSFRSGTSGVPGNEVTDLPVLRSSSVRPMRVDLSDVRFLPDPSKTRKDDLLADGDLLFTRLSGSLDYVANCAVVRGLESRSVFYPDRLFRAKLIDPNSGPYFEICFASPLLRRHLATEAKSSAGHQRISMSAVTEFPIPLPSADERAQIVRRVEALFALADRIEARCIAARARAQRLAPRLLAKAFRGELVPQDPNDETASALLARIAAERAFAVPRTRTRLPRAPRAARVPKETAHMTKSRQDDDVKGQPYLAGHLRRLGRAATAEELFKAAELPVADFYKQLAWEVATGHVKDGRTVLEAGDAA